MAKNNNLGDFLTDIANTIRTKKGTTATINPQDFSSEILSISGGIEDVETSAEMDALLIAANVGKAYRFTGTTDANYTNGDIYVVAEEQSSYVFEHYGTTKPEQAKTVEITEAGTTEVNSEQGYALSKVTITVNIPYRKIQISNGQTIA